VNWKTNGETEFLIFLKEKMQTPMHSPYALLNKKIQKVALCGGAGSFLLPNAVAQKADIFYYRRF
jgi:putative NIF3 family GTP cyclohydrolase 1 type 2